MKFLLLVFFWVLQFSPFLLIQHFYILVRSEIEKEESQYGCATSNLLTITVNWILISVSFELGRFIECFHSHGQHLGKFIGTKESVCIKKEFAFHRTVLGHQHGRLFIVLGHQYGGRDVVWKHSIHTARTITRARASIIFYTMMWILRALWLVVARDLSEDRYNDIAYYCTTFFFWHWRRVINLKSLCFLKTFDTSWYFFTKYNLVNIYKNRPAYPGRWCFSSSPGCPE